MALARTTGTWWDVSRVVSDRRRLFAAAGMPYAAPSAGVFRYGHDMPGVETLLQCVEDPTSRQIELAFQSDRHTADFHRLDDHDRAQAVALMTYRRPPPSGAALACVMRTLVCYEPDVADLIIACFVASYPARDQPALQALARQFVSTYSNIPAYAGV